MPDPIRELREELSRHVAEQGAESPRVAHLRWQIASFERQARRAADGPETAQTVLRDTTSPY
jgi:hypothetical protein